MKRPAFWILFGVVAVVSAGVGFRYFPRAFSIVALDLAMDRGRAHADARAIMARDRLGPADYRQASSFALDNEAQTFVELEGGGKDTFTNMLRDGLYSAYTWRVRHFREGETNETLIRFTPQGQPYGFAERLREDAPGAAIEAPAAQQIAETAARENWHVDFASFTLAEQGQDRRTGGRVDHTFTYERTAPTLNEGRYRLRLVVSGDRLTELTHFIKVPETFARRYEAMRSANEAFGIGSVVGMAVLYVFGGIGVGLFFMLRHRWVLWRQPAIWGMVVALLQVLTQINEWPLLWMSYDTALPRSTYIGQQIALLAVAFLGFSTFFGLSFMAAETLTRRAFGQQPQLWRVWSRGPGSSKTVLGQTIAGYLLVPVFFAYDVVLYLVATRTFGWWSPSEALFHPDVLATYVPWLSAISNSFQAGFWEECLFRAVPLAAAALIGDRFGNRRLFLIAGFIVQSVIFGAGHAPYPNQPSFARPVELIIPSIGFGLLYIYFGLLPGIVLHFAFDVVWFALPIFMANTPGIWIQQVMVIVVTLIPVGIVLWRRVQAGRWTELSPGELNAAWTPPAAAEPTATAPAQTRYAISGRARVAWLAAGAVSFCALIAALVARDTPERMTVGRAEAGQIARRALAGRGVSLDGPWRVMPIPEDGSAGPHRFVVETAGLEQRDALIGRYLPAPRWRVRVARFEGDLAHRAEEWLVWIDTSGQVVNVAHVLPQEREGASLGEEDARRLTTEALASQAKLDVARGEAREISARPSKQKARTDWTFTFVDTTVPLPQGEARVEILVAGDEVARRRSFVFVPEERQRAERAAGTRARIFQIASTVVFAGLLVAAAVTGGIAWSRRRYTPWLFVAGAAMMLLAAATAGVNRWPAMESALSTAQPLALQIAVLAGAGFVGISLLSLLVGLALGALPRRLAEGSRLAERDALQLGVAAGLFGALVVAAAGWLHTPTWAEGVDFSSLATLVPALDVMTIPIREVLTRTAVVLPVLLAIGRLTGGWTRRRLMSGSCLVLIGFLAAGAPTDTDLGRGIAAGLLVGAGLAVAYITLLRADLTMVPVALGTVSAVSLLGRGIQQPFPGALLAALVSTVMLAGITWWWFRALRRWAERAESTTAVVPS